MSTQILPLENNVWTQVATGPTTQPLFVDKKMRGAAVWLVISATEPAYTHDGHPLVDGKTKIVELLAGESLYAFASPGQMNLPASIAITE